MSPAPYTPQASTHTADEVINEVRRTMGDTSGTLFSNADVFAWLNAGQREIAQSVDLYGKASIDVVASTSEYTIDVELAQRVRDIQVIKWGDKVLKPVTFQQAQTMWMADTDGFPAAADPVYWFQYNRTITIVPAPDTALEDGLTIFFARQVVPATLGTDYLDVPDSHYNALIQYVLGRAYQLTQESEMAAGAMNAMQESVRVQASRERRNQINHYPTLVPNEDDY